MAKKTIITDDVIRGLFDPLTDPSVSHLTSEREKNVLFIEKENVIPRVGIIHSEAPFLRWPAFSKNKILVWAGVITFLLLGTHLFLWYGEENLQLLQTRGLLQLMEDQHSLFEKRLRERKAEFQRLQNDLQALREEKVSSGVSLRFLEKGIRRNGLWSQTLAELFRLKPEGIWFEELSIEGNKLEVHGYTFDQNLAIHFWEAMKQLPAFNAPHLKPLQTVEEGGDLFNAFEIDAALLS